MIIDPDRLPTIARTGYPAPYAGAVDGRSWKDLATAAGLTQFGVNLFTLAPGAWSSQRHWHSHEDELVFVLEGTPVLITDAGETTLAPGQACAWPAGLPDGHCLVNRTDKDVVFLAVGTRAPDEDVCVYPDIDLLATPQGFTRRDGTAW